MLGTLPAILDRIETSPSIRVLVIDDDAGYLRLISLVLERYGYGVLTASNAEAAAELAGEAEVALVDMVMPGMSGLELIPVLQWRNPSLSVIASSGGSESEFRRELNQLGVNVFLPKPFPVNRLIEHLEGLSRLATICA
ncbi:MAG TPA: response regulator [Chthoniobacteraceae bacterium]|nr:response regulator [Chthoniobacteraceae bacterium]